MLMVTMRLVLECRKYVVPQSVDLYKLIYGRLKMAGISREIILLIRALLKYLIYTILEICFYVKVFIETSLFT